MKLSSFGHLIAYTTIILIIVSSGCRKLTDDPNDDNSITNMNDLVVASGFQWNTTQEITFSIMALDNQGQPLKNVRFNVFTAHPDSGGVELLSGSTNLAGVMEIPYKIPAYLSEVTITTDYLGLVREKHVPIQNGGVTTTFGGIAPAHLKEGSSIWGEQGTTSYLKYLGTFNAQGVPNYLVSPDYVVTAELLNDINASLPEQQSVLLHHPEYLASNAESNLPLVEA